MTKALVPSPGESQLWIDFDGTITRQDVLDELIRGYAVDDSWKQVELEWQEGRIGSRECLSRQLATVRINDAEIDRFLESIELDRGITTLIQLADRHAVPAAVLSDGLDRFIGPLLRRAGLERLVFRSNAIKVLSAPAIERGDMDAAATPASPLSSTEERRRGRRSYGVGTPIVLCCPFSYAACTSAAAHCKCRSIDELAVRGREGIYIGDGRSDLCPSRKVRCRFAKGVLSANLEREGLPFLPYSDLNEVASILGTVWGAPPAA
jgi:2-hydroxy-3-keto-5-methylthiopentenyl-1-phosphate phosphatase